MSEQMKKDAVRIAEAMNTMSEKDQERMADFMQGVAFAAAQQSSKAENEE